MQIFISQSSPEFGRTLEFVCKTCVRLIFVCIDLDLNEEINSVITFWTHWKSSNLYVFNHFTFSNVGIYYIKEEKNGNQEKRNGCCDLRCVVWLISFLAHFMIITFTILEARRLNFKQLFSVFSHMFFIKAFL